MTYFKVSASFLLLKAMLIPLLHPKDVNGEFASNNYEVIFRKKKKVDDAIARMHC